MESMLKDSIILLKLAPMVNLPKGELYTGFWMQSHGVLDLRGSTPKAKHSKSPRRQPRADGQTRKPEVKQVLQTPGPLHFEPLATYSLDPQSSEHHTGFLYLLHRQHAP